MNSELKQKLAEAQHQQEASTKRLNEFKEKCESHITSLEMQYTML